MGDDCGNCLLGSNREQGKQKRVGLLESNQVLSIMVTQPLEPSG